MTLYGQIVIEEMVILKSFKGCPFIKQLMQEDLLFLLTGPALGKVLFIVSKVSAPFTFYLFLSEQDFQTLYNCLFSRQEYFTMKGLFILSTSKLYFMTDRSKHFFPEISASLFR